jgi:hypothetical protein
MARFDLRGNVKIKNFYAKKHRRQIGKENSDVLVLFPVEETYFNNKALRFFSAGLPISCWRGSRSLIRTNPSERSDG